MRDMNGSRVLLQLIMQVLSMYYIFKWNGGCLVVVNRTRECESHTAVFVYGSDVFSLDSKVTTYSASVTNCI